MWDNGVFLIVGVLFIHGVFIRLLGLFPGTVGVLAMVGVFTVGLILLPGVAAGLFTGVIIVGFSKTFLDFSWYSGLRSGSRPLCAP